MQSTAAGTPQRQAITSGHDTPALQLPQAWFGTLDLRRDGAAPAGVQPLRFLAPEACLTGWPTAGCLAEKVIDIARNPRYAFVEIVPPAPAQGMYTAAGRLFFQAAPVRRPVN
jgi:hypothetical protein